MMPHLASDGVTFLLGWTEYENIYYSGAMIARLDGTGARMTSPLEVADYYILGKIILPAPLAEAHPRFDGKHYHVYGYGDALADGRVVRTHEPQQHGEGNNLGPTVAVRYDPANPTHVVVDASTFGRDITLAIVALKLLVGGPIFVALGARRLRARAPTDAR